MNYILKLIVGSFVFMQLQQRALLSNEVCSRCLSSLGLHLVDPGTVDVHGAGVQDQVPLVENLSNQRSQ